MAISIDELIAAVQAGNEVPPAPPCGVNEIYINGKCLPKPGGGRGINRKQGGKSDPFAGLKSAVDPETGETYLYSEVSEAAACGCQTIDPETETMYPTPAMTPGATPSQPFIPGVGPVSFPTGPCLVFRGFGGGQPVSLATTQCGAGACSPMTPGGLWPVPATFEVPAGGTFALAISTPRDANLWAFIVTRVRGASLPLQSLAPWVSQDVSVTYPKFGSTATVPDPNSAVLPADTYTAESILGGQNPLPPWVPQYNLNATNSLLKSTLSNADVTIAFWDVILLLNYGFPNIPAAT